jgi:hypothetical protein
MLHLPDERQLPEEENGITIQKRKKAAKRLF